MLGEVSFERSDETVVDTVVEKCLEAGRRERGAVDVGVRDVLDVWEGA